MLHYSEIEPVPPYERNSLLFEVSTGCSQAKPCTLCGFYGKSFSIHPMEDLAAQLDDIATVWLTKPKRVFLQSGNPFGIPGDRLIAILELIHEKVPSVETIGGFTRIDDIKHLSDAQLKRLAELGASDLSMGAESGVDETLEILGKVHRSHDIVEQCARLDAVGIDYTLWYIVGGAGAGKCIENARVSAKVYSQAHPKRIYLTTLGLFPNSQLQTMVDNGEFELASVYENIQDTREFLAWLECETLVDGLNGSNFVLFQARLPENREETLANIDAILAKPNKKTAVRPERKLEIVGGQRVAETVSEPVFGHTRARRF